MVSQNNLTKPIVIPTSVPSPSRQNVMIVASPDARPETITLRSCSEFMEHVSPVQYWNTASKIQALQDLDGNPMVFAIGENNALNCLTHKSGAAAGWVLYSLSPSSDKIVTFDVMKFDSPDDLTNAGLFVTVATSDSTGFTTVHHAWLSAIVSDVGENKIASIDFTRKPEWTTISDPGGQKIVTTLSIGKVSAMNQASTDSFVIIAGTETQGDREATFYVIDPYSDVANPWTAYSLDTDEDFIKELQPASIGTPQDDGTIANQQGGVWTLSQKREATDCLFYALDPKTLEKTNSLSTQRPKVGRINSICASRNPWGLTDVALACESGVCLINVQDITGEAIVVSGLPSTKFTSVVCSELVNADSTATAFTMFAISSQAELYYIEGSRDWSTGDITLRSSGLPIRADVARMSCQYNVKLNSSELIYNTVSDNEVKHLLRDPVTKMWSENVMRYEAPKMIKSYQAFVTTLSVQSSNGRALSNFTLTISAQSTVVMINDRSYILSTGETEVATDSRGQIVVVSATADKLHAPSYNFKISAAGIEHTEILNSGQRITENLSSLKGEDAILDAKTTTGARVFSTHDIVGKEQNFRDSSQLLSDFPLMLKAVGTKSDGSTDSSPRPILGPIGEIRTTTKPANIENDWVTDVTDDIGDAIEFIETVVETELTAVFTVVAEGLKLLLTIAGKTLSFAIKTVGPLLKTLNTFLKKRLGIDSGKIFRWLGLTFDNEKTKVNQEVIQKSVRAILSLPNVFLESNTSNLANFFDSLERDLQPYIDDKSQPKFEAVQDPNTALRNLPLAWLLDNPVLSLILKLNPLGIITDALSTSFGSVFGDDVRLPTLSNFSAQLTKTLADTFNAETKIVVDLLEKLWKHVKDAVNDPSKLAANLKGAFQDIAHSLFDTVKIAVEGIWTLLTEVTGLVMAFLEDTWKIPFVTDLFEWYAGQEYSLMNVLTFVIARLSGIIIGDDNVGSLFDLEDTTSQMMRVVSSTNLFSSLSNTTPEPPAIKSVDIQPVESARTSTEAHIGGTTAAVSEKAEHNDKGTSSKLSEDAENQLRLYEKRAKITSCIVGVIRLSTVTVEAISLILESQEVSDKRNAHLYGSKPEEYPEEISPLFGPSWAIVSCVFGFSASLVQYCYFQIACENEEVRDRLETLSRSVGLNLSLFASLFACGNSCAALYAVKNHDEAGGRSFSINTAVSASISSYSDALGVHIIAERDTPDFAAKSADAVEIIATTCGLIAAFGSYSKNIEFASDVGMLDASFTLLSVFIVLSEDIYEEARYLIKEEWGV